MAVDTPQLIFLVHELFCSPTPQMCCIWPGLLEGSGRHAPGHLIQGFMDSLTQEPLRLAARRRTIQVSCCILGTGSCSHRVAASL